MLNSLKRAGLREAAHFNKFNVLGFLPFEQRFRGVDTLRMTGSRWNDGLHPVM